METFKEFLKHINIRLSNPFFFSFVISWLVLNWQVPVGLIFYDKDQLAIDGFYTYICLITSSVTNRSGIWLPLLGAFIYTVISPIVSLIISAFQTLINKYSEQINLGILKGSKIPLDKYLALSDSLNLKEKKLEEIIESQSEFVKKYDEANAINTSLNSKIKDLNADIISLEEIKNAYDGLKRELAILQSIDSYFTGTWIFESNIDNGSDVISKSTIMESFYIKGNEYWAHDKLRFEIKNIRAVESQSLLTFHKKKVDETDYVNAVYLIKITEKLWIGWEKLSDKRIAYIRLYPKNSLPNYFPLYFQRREIDNLNYVRERALELADAIRL